MKIKDILIQHKYLFLLFFISFALYAQTLNYGFVFDDQNLIVKNNLIKSYAYIPDIFTKEFFNEPGSKSGYYRPLINFSFLLEYKLAGLTPFIFHLTNVLIHALNTVLVALIFFIFTDRKKLAAVLAFFFCILPVHTSAVAYIAGRTDLLNAFFIFLSVLFLTKNQKQKNNTALSASLICFFLSLLCKETTIVFPFFLGVYLYSENKLKKEKKTLIYFFVVGVLFMLIRNNITTMPLDSLILKDIVARLFNINKIITTYIILLVFPNNLHFERTSEILPLTDAAIIFSVVANAIIITALILLIKRKKQALITSSLFILFLLPVIHLIPIFVQGKLFTAEHFLYLPSIGFIGTIGFALKLLLQTYPQTKKAITFMLSIFAIFFILQTLKTNQTYANADIFYRHNLKYTPNSTRLLNNYGNLLAAKGQADMALQQYHKALAVNPNKANTHYNIGTLFIKTGDYNKAIVSIKKAIELEPKRDEYYNNLSVTFSRIKKYEDALKYQQKAHELLPQEADYIYNMGIFSLSLKRYAQAKDFFKDALKLRNTPEYLTALASVYFAEQKYEDALKQNLKALKLSPNNQEALFNTAICYLVKRNESEGLRLLQKIIEIDNNTIFAKKAAYEISRLKKTSRRLSA